MRRVDLTGGQQSFEDFGEVLYPDEAQEPILAKPVRDALTEWLTEIWAADELKAVGLKPRQKALFTGPPGGGKTTLAHHLAARLKLALVCVRSERLIDAYIGSTGRNIGALFDLATASEKVVLFIDEFDSLGLKRRSASQGAEDERNSSVNVLLQRMERYDGFLIAASNRGADIDEAIWRRFDIQIKLALPGQGERERILARYLAPYAVPGDELAALAEAFNEASPALMRQFCEGLKRQLIIGPKVGWEMERGSVFARLVAAVGPHPDLPRPRLWHRGAEDRAVVGLTWPLRTMRQTRSVAA
jgi:SpoVK/Ycf46/Vps4 family AAA+-type ATPase